MSVVVIDIGSSSVKTSEVSEDGRILRSRSVPTPAFRPSPSQVEYDAEEIFLATLTGINAILEKPIQRLEGLAITNQRASSVLWSRTDHRAKGPVLSWQDTRTAPVCLALGARNISLAPNEAASKYAYLVTSCGLPRQDVMLGTLESWIIYRLSGGETHLTDVSNAAMTGLTFGDASGYDDLRINALGLNDVQLPLIVPTSGELARASILREPLPILASIGDQQASLIGQGCVSSGMTKLTLGTGGMMDLYLGDQRPTFPRRGPGGSYPVVACTDESGLKWALEAVLLNAGSCIDWLCNSLGLASSPHESQALSEAASKSDRTIFIPALSGLACPDWDFGARGTFLNIRKQTGKQELFRAAIRGIAQSCADLVEALEVDSGMRISELRIDGKMANNAVMRRELSDATALSITTTDTVECTTLGAAFLAHIELGNISSITALDDLYRPNSYTEPTSNRGSQSYSNSREAWQEAKSMALNQIPELSLVTF